MTTTPADELRAAAQQLRALATAASTDTDGTPTTTWSTAPCWPDDPDGTSRLYGDYRTRDDGRRIAWPPLLKGGSQQRPTRMHTQHAAYAAVMGPALGLVLADWLDSWTGVEVSEHGPMPEDARHALAVARQILRATKDTTVQTAVVCICGHPEQRHFEDVCLTCGCGDYLEPQDAAEVIDRWRQAALQARATIEQNAAKAALSDPERQFLIFALDLAFDAMVSRDGFDDEDHAALARFRRMADEAQQPAPAATEEPK